MSPAISIAVAHNRYRSTLPSGENAAVEQEIAALRARGHEVTEFVCSSDDLIASGRLGQLRAALRLTPGLARLAELRSKLAARRAQVLHVHNPWPMWTLGIFSAARSAGLATVMTLHNHRLFATNTRLLGPAGARRPRDAAERTQVALMAASHGNRLTDWFYRRALSRAWRAGLLANDVQAFLAFTAFQRDTAISAGLPADRVVVVPSRVPDVGLASELPGESLLFAGRLTADKGFDVVIKAWSKHRLPPLTVIGNGPLAAAALNVPGITLRGLVPANEARQLMRHARALVVGSTVYEPGSLVTIEALAAGTPVVVPDLGSFSAEFAARGVGWAYAPGDAEALALAVRRAWDEAPARRGRCRALYEERHLPVRALERLEQIYANLLAGRPAGAGLPI